VRGALAWLVAWIASCAPDYAHTAFRCDADHGCPAGQTCLDGRCRRGAPTGDGVVCGAATCDASHQCCLDQLNPPRCIAAGDVCPGTSALCDGSEDCQAGDRCCADGGTVFCDAACDRYACRDAADCPSTAPNCCPDDTAPWGECSPSGC
jgi:hypothetical protein